MPLLEECLRAGKQLIAKKDVTDTHVIRDRMKVRTLKNELKLVLILLNLIYFTLKIKYLVLIKEWVF